MGLSALILRVRRADTPVFRLAKRVARGCMTASLPVPRFAKPAGHAIYHFHFFLWFLGARLLTLLYREPLFRSRCEHVGKRLMLTLLPEAPDHTTIIVGDDVSFHGKIGIYSGRASETATLRIGNRVSIGHLATISCNREVVIEDDVYISNSCSISDNDGHPIDPDLRSAGLPAPPEKTRPVRISRQAWIGAGCFILKGVTIGQAAIIGAGSVVRTDIPPYSIAMGNPAQVVKHLRKPDDGGPTGSDQAKAVA